MYEAFYGFRQRPFAATPDPRCVFETANWRATIAALENSLHGRQGISVLTGAAGSGKSLLCRAFCERLPPAMPRVLLSHANFSTRRGVLQAILYELRESYSHLGEQELRLELTTWLKQRGAGERPLVLICDEAENLDEPLIEELRLLAELVEGGMPLVHLILCGQFGLEEKLAQPELQAFNQRLAVQAYLDPLTRQESREYLSYRVQFAGGDIDAVFTPEALELMAKAADGVPRALNQLADHSLLLSFVGEQKPVDQETVREALEDLRHLPLHWNIPASGHDGPTADTASERLDAEAAETAAEWNAIETDAEYTSETRSESDAATEATADQSRPRETSSGRAPLPAAATEILDDIEAAANAASSAACDQAACDEEASHRDAESALAAIEIDFGDMVAFDSPPPPDADELPSDPEMEIIGFNEEGQPLTISGRRSLPDEMPTAEAEPVSCPESKSTGFVPLAEDWRQFDAPPQSAAMTTEFMKEAAMSFALTPEWNERQLHDADTEIAIFDRYALIDAGLIWQLSADAATVPVSVSIGHPPAVQANGTPEPSRGDFPEEAVKQQPPQDSSPAAAEASAAPSDSADDGRTSLPLNDPEELHWLINTRLQFVEEDTPPEATATDGPEESLLQAASELCEEAASYLRGTPAEESLVEDAAEFPDSVEEDPIEETLDDPAEFEAEPPAVEAAEPHPPAMEDTASSDPLQTGEADTAWSAAAAPVEPSAHQPPAQEPTATAESRIESRPRTVATGEEFRTPVLQPHARPARRFSNLFSRLREMQQR